MTNFDITAAFGFAVIFSAELFIGWRILRALYLNDCRRWDGLTEAQQDAEREDRII